MVNITENWNIQLDITSHCGHGCTYCSRYNKHLKNEQRYHMSLEKVEQALDSLKGWPNRIGIIGGEPILHPQFAEICKLIQARFPRDKMGLWTSGGPKYQQYLPLINETFSLIAYNEHSEFQLETCKHQPLTCAIGEVIPDVELREQLLSDCWVQRSWGASINNFGGYFCEIAGAQDLVLNDGVNAWPLVEGWWNKTPEQFKDQKEKLCGQCGMAIPMDRELLKKTTEKFTPKLLEVFRNKELRKVSDEDVELFTETYTREQVKANIDKWTPGNYRGDLQADETACEGKGFTLEIE